jgi:hypothetical protein
LRIIEPSRLAGQKPEGRLHQRGFLAEIDGVLVPCAGGRLVLRKAWDNTKNSKAETGCRKAELQSHFVTPERISLRKEVELCLVNGA